MSLFIFCPKISKISKLGFGRIKINIELAFTCHLSKRSILHLDPYHLPPQTALSLIWDPQPSLTHRKISVHTQMSCQLHLLFHIQKFRRHFQLNVRFYLYRQSFIIQTIFTLKIFSQQAEAELS